MFLEKVHQARAGFPSILRGGRDGSDGWRGCGQIRFVAQKIDNKVGATANHIDR